MAAMCAKLDDIGRGAFQFARIFQDDDAVAGEYVVGEKRICERRLAR